MIYHPVLCVVIFGIVAAFYVIMCKREGCD